MSEDLSISNIWCRGGRACSGFFFHQITFWCTSCKEWEGKEQGKEGEKRKGSHPQRNQECLSLPLPPLPCIHCRQLFIISFCPRGYKCRHLWENNPKQGFVSSWKFSANFHFGHFLSSGIVCSLFEKTEEKMQPKQHFSFSSKVSILIYWKLVQSVIYILSVKDSKNFIRNRYFHGNVHLWWDVVPQMFQLKDFVSSSRKKKSRGQNKDQAPRKTCNASS